MEILAEYDVVLDGSDNFPTRFLMNDACYFMKKTLISASIFRFDGQITTIKAHAGHPCYRCLYHEPPPPGLVPSCQEAGVLGVLAGTVGVLQATEALKEVLGIGRPLYDRLMIYDALEMTFREVKIHKDPNCPLCGTAPTITDLGIHAGQAEPDLDAALRNAYRHVGLPYPEGTFLLAGFAHVMEGYDAGYYGYLWAEVIGDDMFGRFESEGVTSPEVGAAYRREILEPNGARPAAELVRAFLGRDPTPAAWLRLRGMD